MLRSVALALTLAVTPAAVADTSSPDPKTFAITASKYKFEPSTIEVTQGDRVILKIRSTDSVHGLAVKEFKAKVKIPKNGEEVSLEFVAERPGTFRFTCSEYCGGGHSGMKGTLIVHPKAE